MKHLRLIIILFGFASCKVQHSLKEYTFPQVGWILRISVTSKFLDSLQIDTLRRKVINAVNESYDTVISLNDVKSLFTIRQGQFNFLGSSIKIFDTTLGETWEQSYAISKQVLLQVINQQAPAVKIIDTLSSYEIIDGLRFEKLYLKTFYPDKGLTMNAYWFYRKQNNYDFSISIAYTDEIIGKQFLNLIKRSKFKK